MRKFIRVLLVAACAAIGVSATAQQQEQTVTIPSPIMVIDFERVFSETLYGKRIAADVTAERALVQAENEDIVALLLAEESDLTDARATMDVDEFREAAAAFNERAQAVRTSREREQARLQELLDGSRAQFLERIQPIVAAMMVQRGAVVAMDRRSVIQALGGANATEDAIAIIDDRLGDGKLEPGERPTLRPDGVSPTQGLLDDPVLDVLPETDLSGSD